ncbi:aminodeoxychorismate lyase [Candidatus Methylospira mobilis]|uniref:aminodeoxychorismate lyase n=1 Tax=Candidatus Methylospira mobilis TaxID=1808979 RepID=UPI0018858EDA|nr:aminodeoxychorismate lyase [Candidatus Methylospira mobilis]WNV04600.1 aminodeoxychorismate lyase [Candidatus Methylospira mobilis]
MADQYLAFVNGVPESKIALTDRGFQYGDGIFTTLPVIREQPVLLGRHIARLQRDCARLSISFPDEHVLRREIETICRQSSDSVLKIMLTRGSGGRGYRPPLPGATTRVLTTHPLPNYPEAYRQTGIRLARSEINLAINPVLAGIKHMNRLEQILARSACSDPDIQEILMLDVEDYVVEAGMSNIFAVRDKLLQTPLLDRCGVSGVMRAHVIDIAQAMGLRVEETRMRVESIQQAEEVFLTNSLFPIWPVRCFESRRYDSWPVTRLLLDSMPEWRF